MAGRRASIALLAVIGLQACASGPTPVTGPIAPAGPAATVQVTGLRAGEDYPTQRLYRVRYQGPEGQGSLKLTLRIEAPGRFQLSAADPLGRAVWSLEVDSGTGRFIDHRRQVACDLQAEVRLTQVVLAKLPVRSLAAVLLGRLPSPPAEPFEDTGSERQRLKYTDLGGRRWSAVVAGGEVESWTLWEGDRPLLWWSHQPGGAILSAQEGAQFRWRETVSEALSGELEPLETPPGYESGQCNEGVVAAGAEGAD